MDIFVILGQGACAIFTAPATNRKMDFFTQAQKPKGKTNIWMVRFFSFTQTGKEIVFTFVQTTQIYPYTEFFHWISWTNFWPTCRFELNFSNVETKSCIDINIFFTTINKLGLCLSCGLANKDRILAAAQLSSHSVCRDNVPQSRTDNPDWIDWWINRHSSQSLLPLLYMEINTQQTPDCTEQRKILGEQIKRLGSQVSATLAAEYLCLPGHIPQASHPIIIRSVREGPCACIYVCV